jgi:hypothetical protein
LLILTLVFLAALTGAQAGESYDLKYKGEKGERFSMKVKHKHRNEREVLGNSLETNSQDVTEYAFRVTSSDGDGMGLEMTYQRRSHSSDDPRSTTPVDFSSLVGQKVKMRLTSRGELATFEGFDRLPSIKVPDERTTLDEHRYVQELENLFPVFAGRGVSVGEEWTHTRTYDEPVPDGQLSVTVEYRYEIAEATKHNGVDCTRLVGSHTVRGSGQVNVGGMPMGLRLEGMGTETIYFAHKRGVPLEIESSSTVSGEASSDELGIAIPFQHNYETVVEVAF